MIAPEPDAPPSRIYAGMAGGAAAQLQTQGEQGDAACILQGHGPHGARFESGGSVAQVPGFGAAMLALRMADAIAPAGTVTVITDNCEAMETIRNRRTRSTVTARRPHTREETAHLIEARIEAIRLADAQAAGRDGESRFRHLPGLLGGRILLDDAGCRKGRFQGTVALPAASPAWSGPATDREPPGGIEPGAIIEVLQIRARIGTLSTRWWPVRSRGHHDQTFFRTPDWHWHIDRRFTDEAMEQTLAQAAGASATPAHIVIGSTKVRPVRGTGEGQAPDRALRYYRLADGTVTAYSAGGMRNAIDPASWQRTTPLTCRRTDPESHPQLPEGHDMALENLQAHYAGRLWARTRRCPHQDYPLAGLAPDRHGFIHCPLHGLLLDARSGKIASLDDAIGCWNAQARKC